MAADPALSNLPPLRTVIAAHGLAARKSLGQHFLLDLNLTRRIVRAGNGLEGSCVVEVGPGPGGLTRALLETGADPVIAIEKDRRCREALMPLTRAAGGRLHLIDADALRVDERTLLENAGVSGRDVRIVSNLPFNVSAPLIVKWLRQMAEARICYRSLVLTVQKEVAERLAARPGTKAYGRLSVMCQWLTEPTLCFDIGPRAFVPPPKVTSSVVHLVPRQMPPPRPRWADMEAVARAAFGQRRKMLRSSLRALVAGGDTTALLSASGLSSSLRAEDVDIGGFCTLARAYGKQRSGGDGASHRQIAE